MTPITKQSFDKKVLTGEHGNTTIQKITDFETKIDRLISRIDIWFVKHFPEYKHDKFGNKYQR